MSDFSVSIKATLDLSGIDSKIKEIAGKEAKLNNITLDTSKIASSIQTELNKYKFTIDFDKVNMSNVTSEMQKSGTGAAKSFSSSFNSGLSQITTTSIKKTTTAYNELLAVQKQINSINIQKAGLDPTTNSNRINELNSQLEKCKTKYQELYNEVGKSLSTAQIDKLNSNFQTAAEKIEIIKAKMADMNSSVLKSVDSGLSTGKFSSELASLEAQMSRFENVSENLRTNFSNLTTAFNGMSSSNASIEEKVSAYKQWAEILPQVKTELDQLNKAEKESAKAQETLTKSSTLSNKISAWMNTNAKAAEVYGEELKRIQEALSQNQDPTVLKNASLQFAEITAKAKAAGLVTNSFAKSLKDVVLQAAGLSSTYMVFNKIVQVTRQGVNAIIELDTALVDLKKTAQASASQLESFYYTANDIAKQYGATTQEIIQSTADWSRLGYSLSDSELMAQYSSMFKSISPGMDVDTATESLVSIMKAYGIEAENILDGVMSKINEVGNTAATSNSDIAEGLKLSASAMQAMGSTFEENIALFVAGQEITQDASKVGNAIRSIAMRIRGYDEETEELSDDLVNITGEVIDLTKAASNNGQGISLFTDASQTEYKTPYQYLKDISGVIDEIDAKSKQELLEKLFGKNRASIGAAILENFSAAEKAMDTMANSAGSAEAEMNTIMESIDYKLNRLKETGTGIFQNIFSRDDIGAAIELLTSFLEIIDKITGSIGGLPAILTAVTAGLSLKNIGRDKMFSLA